MSGKRRSPLHRATIIAAIQEGEALAEVNRRLAKIGGWDVPQSTYDSVKKTYLPKIISGAIRLGDWIEHPKPIGDLPDDDI